MKKPSSFGTQETRRSSSRSRTKESTACCWNFNTALILFMLLMAKSTTMSSALIRQSSRMRTSRCPFRGARVWTASSRWQVLSRRSIPFGRVDRCFGATATSRAASRLGIPQSYRSFSSFSSLFVTAVDDEYEVSQLEDSEISAQQKNKTVESEWDVTALKKETQRLQLRCHKKIGKAHQRLQSAQQQVTAFQNNPHATLAEFEQCPNVEAFQLELQELQTRLQRLNELETLLSNSKGSNKSKMVLPLTIAQLVLDLNVRDEPLVKPPRGPAKPKGPRERPCTRLPYRRYYSYNNVEIRVGKKAADNDQLTLNVQHRDNNDWWMHASGCPGSHVIIRCHDNVLDSEVKLDAAVLAARHSKCRTPVIKVSLTRARDIRKPIGAKDGLVQLVGRVETVVVDMKATQERLKRLDATELVN